jgi:hypothetical protein
VANEQDRKRLPIAGYCFNIEGDDYKDCHKIIDNRCSVYADVCRKMGRSQNIGCAFSPLERTVAQKGRVRIGQQKQRKRR